MLLSGCRISGLLQNAIYDKTCARSRQVVCEEIQKQHHRLQYLIILASQRGIARRIQWILTLRQAAARLDCVDRADYSSSQWSLPGMDPSVLALVMEARPF